MSFYQKLGANRVNRLRLAKDTLYQIIARIASSGVSFLITILIARHFGVSSYGDYAKVTAFVSTFYLLADFGFNAIYLQKDEAPERFRDLFYTRSILSTLLIFIVIIIAFILPYNSTTGIGFSPFVRVSIALFSVTIFTESILFSTFAVFQRKYVYKRFMLATVVGSVVTLTLVGLFILFGLSLFFVFIAYVLGAIVEAAASLLFAEEKLFPLAVHRRFIQELFYETFPVTLMLVFNLLYFRIDTFLLSLFRPSVDVGIYDISYRVFDFLIALPLFLSNVIYPKLIADEKNNQTGKAKVFVYVFRFFVGGIIVAIPFWFISPIIFLIIKPQLLPAATSFRLLLLSLPIFFATNILQWILISKKQQQSLVLIYFALTLANILLNLLFIPQFGYIASAIITGLGELVVLALLGWRILNYD